jgi:phenylacetic acid degradation operon negative regulatory protein
MKKKSSIQKAILRAFSENKPVSIDTVKKTAEKAILREYEGKNPDYAINRSIKNMVSDGFVEALSSEHSQYFRLTPLGKQKLNNIAIEAEGGLISTKWDGYWLIVLLDLPEDRKSEREALRYLLKKAGFICVKNSVWVSMLPFENLFINIKTDLGLTTELIILVTDKLDTGTENAFLKLVR